MNTLKDRLGCSSITFRHQSLFKALETIVSTGLKKMDIACIPGFCPHINPLEFSQAEEQALQERLQSLGVTVSTLNVSAGGLNTDQRDFAFRFIEAAIDLAARLGCYAITIPTGRKVSDPELWKENALVSAQAIRKLADCAGSAGIQLTLETPHAGSLTETIAETHRFYGVLNEPRVGNTFDTSHVAKGNPLSVAQCIAEIGAQIGHVHFRDCIGENNHLTPGKGKIDFKAVIQELDRVGYAGDLIFELEGEESKSVVEELVYAINCLDNL